MGAKKTPTSSGVAGAIMVAVALVFILMLLGKVLSQEASQLRCLQLSIAETGAESTLVCVDSNYNLVPLRSFPRKWFPDGHSEIEISPNF